jgi:2-polyprenyl-3-methyl-5-hydroxy-6-metoxy-1,4-benzoquinol methylase
MDVVRSQDWKEFFAEQAATYLDNPFTAFTKEEVSFILSLFSIPEGGRILDVGCGVGRHAVEFAQRGYKVTGVDFSPEMLAEARKLATRAGVEVEWVEQDATTFKSDEMFDAAICLCEGAFNLIGPEEEPVAHDMGILRSVSAVLKPGAHFVLNTLNAFAFIRQINDQAVEQRSFDPKTMIATYRDIMRLPTGEKELRIRERLYIPPEVTAMLVTAGFDVLALYGGTAGEWARRPLKLDEIEAMFVARKRA